jgi:hypothetical protein
LEAIGPARNELWFWACCPVAERLKGALMIKYCLGAGLLMLILGFVLFGFH